jgi:zinc transport system substrate-binding protein
VRRPLLLTGLIPVAALVLSGCAATSSTSTTAPAGDASASAAPASASVDVVASFYPLEWAAQRVGGDRVAVTSLTAPGAEPHDLELTPQQVAAVQDADLVLHVAEFQPAVDDAIAQSQSQALDVASGLATLAPPEHSDDAHAGEERHSEGSYDPHVWLDPTNMSAIVAAVAERLATIDPSGAQEYAANAAAAESDLAALDTEWKAGTATCTSRDLVVSHEAFGYLAKRYGFEQVGISGLSPEAEPSPARIAEVADFVRANAVTTIYFETLVDPKVAQTVADETGATTAVLDPLEGLAEGSAGDYLSVMRDNLETVKAGQGCS